MRKVSIQRNSGIVITDCQSLQHAPRYLAGRTRKTQSPCSHSTPLFDKKCSSMQMIAEFSGISVPQSIIQPTDSRVEGFTPSTYQHRLKCTYVSNVPFTICQPHFTNPVRTEERTTSHYAWSINSTTNALHPSLQQYMTSRPCYSWQTPETAACTTTNLRHVVLLNIDLYPLSTEYLAVLFPDISQSCC